MRPRQCTKDEPRSFEQVDASFIGLAKADSVKHEWIRKEGGKLPSSRNRMNFYFPSITIGF